MFIPHICMDEIQAVITVVQTSDITIPALMENVKLAFSVCKRQVCAGRCKRDEEHIKDPGLVDG